MNGGGGSRGEILLFDLEGEGIAFIAFCMRHDLNLVLLGIGTRDPLVFVSAASLRLLSAAAGWGLMPTFVLEQKLGPQRLRPLHGDHFGL